MHNAPLNLTAFLSSLSTLSWLPVVPVVVTENGNTTLEVWISLGSATTYFCGVGSVTSPNTVYC